jgi:uncharacterized membrane protein
MEEAVMNKFVVAVFPDEQKAYQGTRALKELHSDGSLTLYGMAVVAKDAKGVLSVKESAGEGPLGAAVGALVGGFVGILGGPVGVLAGAAGGTFIGSLTDLFNYGISEDFLVEVSTMLQPGKTVIIAEIAETWTIPLDTRMEAAGGIVLRTWRADFEDEQIARDVAATQADLEQLSAEFKQATADAKAKVKAKMDQARAKLEQAQERLKGRLAALEKEANAKIAALEQQVANAQADTKEKVKQRIAAARADFDRRSSKLKQAWALTKEALAA